MLVVTYHLTPSELWFSQKINPYYLPIEIIFCPSKVVSWFPGITLPICDFSNPSNVVAFGLPILFPKLVPVRFSNSPRLPMPIWLPLLPTLSCYCATTVVIGHISVNTDSKAGAKKTPTLNLILLFSPSVKSEYP